MTDQTRADWLRGRVAELRTISGNYPLMETHREIQRLESIAADLEAKDRRINELIQAGSKVNSEICQTLGKALGYPTIHTGTVNGQVAIVSRDYPGAVATDDVCVGDHVAETLATEAASKIAALTVERDRLREALGLSSKSLAETLVFREFMDEHHDQQNRDVMQFRASRQLALTTARAALKGENS